MLNISDYARTFKAKCFKNNYEMWGLVPYTGTAYLKKRIFKYQELEKWDSKKVYETFFA